MKNIFIFFLFLFGPFGLARADSNLISTAAGRRPGPSSSTPTNTPTPSPTLTSTKTPTDTWTFTPTKSPTSTRTNSATPTPTKTITHTRTITPTKTPTYSPTPSPTITSTFTPNPCSFPFGVTITGTNYTKGGNAFESPLTISAQVSIQNIYCYASQAETITTGIYNSSNSLMKSVTLISNRAGWCSASFPIILTPANYYLGRYGNGVNTNLASGAGVGCFYDKTGNLPNSFTQVGTYGSLGTPIYLTGCRPLTIIGNFYGIGGSITQGTGASSLGTQFLKLFTSWLNVNYGPVTFYNEGISGVDSYDESNNISKQLEGTSIALCAFEIGSANFFMTGLPGYSNCGGVSLSAGVSNSLKYEADLNKMVSAIKSHMVPGGILMMMNIYETDDFVYKLRFPGWKDYPAILKIYNKIIAKVASANGAKQIDLYSLFAANPSFINSMECHPNDVGQAAIAELLKRSIE